MVEIIKKYQRVIGIVFIAISVVLFADLASDLGYEVVHFLGEIMLGVILFAVGYAFVFHGRRGASRPAEKPIEDEPGE